MQPYRDNPKATQNRDRPASRDVKRAPLPSLATFWILPAVFAIHDGEELITMGPWLAANRGRLEQLTHHGRLGKRLVASLPTSSVQVAFAIGAVALLVLVATVGAASTRRRGFWLYLYSTILGLLSLHVFTHVAQAVILRSYVPGLLGAVVAVLPGSLIVYKRLIAARLLTARTAVATALLGIVLFVPGALAAFTFARWLAS
jgi:hypothetical protein